MGVTPEMIDAMIAAGLTREQMATLMKASLAQAEAEKADKRAKAAAKKRRQRAGVTPVTSSAGNAECPSMSPGHMGTSGDIGGQTGTEGDNPAAPLDGPPLPPAPPSPPLNPPTTPDSLSADVAADLPADPVKASTQRGHRIPDDFAQRPEAFAVCAEFGLAGGQASEALAEFVDYWAALPGKSATKLDWCRTLRNRLRETARRRGPPAGRPPPPGRGNGFGHLAAQKRAARQMEDGDDHATEHHTDRSVRPAHPGAARSAEGDARGGYGDGPGQVLDLVARRAYG